MSIEVRRAILDDASAISGLFREQIGVWQRLDARGRVEDVPYAALTLHERWLHGGAWMSVETSAIHLAHLLLGAGLPLVAVFDGGVVGYAEAYLGAEHEPYGAHLHLAHAVGHGEAKHALIEAVFQHARTLKCARVTLAQDAALIEAVSARTAPQPLARLPRVSVPARTGQGFYKAVEHHDPNPAQIAGWMMPSGRTTSARQQWEALWFPAWDTLPPIRERTHRLRFSAAGQDALVCVQARQHDPRSADVYAWSPRLLSGGMLTAIRNWAFDAGFRTLWLLVPEDALKTLPPDAEPDGLTHTIMGAAV